MKPNYWIWMMSVLLAGLTGSTGLSSTRSYSGYQVPEGPFLFVTPAQIENARNQANHVAWAMQIKDLVLKQANSWSEMAYEDLVAFVPAAGSYYIYGLARPKDPVTGELLFWNGWSDPWTLSPKSNGQGEKRVYPSVDCPDEGKGWLNPSSGELHYFAAYANAERIREFEQRIIPALTNAWLLTGDEKYSSRAIWLLDAIATIYPSADSGPLDYPGILPGSTGGGRLQRPYYQAARALMRYAYAYDVLSGLPEIDQPSPSAPQMTARENILRNLIHNGGSYCYEQAVADSRLNNGTIDYNRGALIAGALLGIPEYLDYAIYGPNGLEAAVYNSIDPQGRYFESSASYAGHTIDLLLTLARMGHSLNSGMKQPLPSFMNNSRLAELCIHFFSSTQISGRLPSYGDGGPDRFTATSDRWFDPRTYLASLSFLEMSEDAEIRGSAARMLYWLQDGQGDLTVQNFNRLRSYSSEALEIRLFYEHGLTELFKELELTESDRALAPAKAVLFPSSGSAILRYGLGGIEESGLFLRYGPTFNHGQMDEMNLQFFANGRELSGDPGHFNTHYRFGFTRTTVAHNLLVVDRQNQLKEPSVGGSVVSWTPGSRFSSVEVDNPSSYQSLNLDQYRRRVAAVQTDGVSYWLDTFRAKGGETYDYSFHALLDGEVMVDEKSQLQLKSQRKGSVYSESVNYSEELTPDGKIKSHLDKPFYWAPPGQGFSFLGNPRFYTPSKVVNLLWNRASDGTQVRWYHLPPAGAEIILAHVSGPNRLLELDYALSHLRTTRKTPVAFTSLIQPITNENADSWQVSELRFEGTPDSAAGVEVKGDGFHHLWVNSDRADVEQRLADGIRFRGNEAFVSFDSSGGPRLLTITGNGYIRVKDIALRAIPVWPQSVQIMEIRENPLRVKVPTGANAIEKAVGSLVSIQQKGYAKPLVYQIVAVERSNEGEWLTLNADNQTQSMLVVDRVKGSELLTKSEFPFLMPQVDRMHMDTGISKPVPVTNGLFEGMALKSKRTDALVGVIESVSTDRKSWKVKNLDSQVGSGEILRIVAPVVGSDITILPWAQASYDGEQWQIEGFGEILHGKKSE